MKSLLQMGLFAILTSVVPNTVNAYDLSRYATTELDDFLTSVPKVTNLSLPPPRKMRIEAYLAGYAQPCDTQTLKIAMTLQGAPRAAIEQVKINHCIDLTSDAGHTITAYIQDEVARHLPKETSVGAHIIWYVDYLYINEKGPALLVNEFDTP